MALLAGELETGDVLSRSLFPPQDAPAQNVTGLAGDDEVTDLVVTVVPVEMVNDNLSDSGTLLTTGLPLDDIAAPVARVRTFSDRVVKVLPVDKQTGTRVSSSERVALSVDHLTLGGLVPRPSRFRRAPRSAEHRRSHTRFELVSIDFPLELCPAVQTSLSNNSHVISEHIRKGR